jgi:hypothetical protein
MATGSGTSRDHRRASPVAAFASPESISSVEIKSDGFADRDLYVGTAFGSVASDSAVNTLPSVAVTANAGPSHASTLGQLASTYMGDPGLVLRTRGTYVCSWPVVSAALLLTLGQGITVAEGSSIGLSFGVSPIPVDIDLLVNVWFKENFANA